MLIGIGIGIPFTRRRGFSAGDLFASGEVGVWYDPSDLTTMFQNSAGTTAVTSVEQPVGLILDKSKGLVLGSTEFVVNGSFDSDLTGWTTGVTGSTGTAEWVSGAIRLTNTSFYGREQSITTVIGKTYKITASITAVSGLAGARVLVTTGANRGGSILLDSVASNVPKEVSGYFTAIGTTTYISVNTFTGTAGVTADFDNISVREIPGYHATQATSTARPVLRQDASGHYYLDFDGVDDFLVTSAINFTGTDKMSVFAGVTKEGSTTAALIEQSINSGSNNGTFAVFAPYDATYEYSSFSHGDAAAATGHNAFANNALYNSPNTAVISSTHDISADSSILQINTGTTGITAGTLDKGAGNFGNYPLYIGMRAGTSLPFNGRIYSLIVRGALSDAAQIAAAESYVNSKTGAY